MKLIKTLKEFQKLIIIAFLILLTSCSQKLPGPQLTAASSMEKIPFDLKEMVNDADTAKINAAGGEYESFQVLVSGDSLALKGVRWKVNPLKNKTGEIETAHIEINPVGYVETTEKMDNYEGALGWYPDPLLRLDSLDIPVGERQPLWVTVYIPSGTPAGVYEGSIQVSAENSGKSEIPVELRVWDFDIPRTPSIKTLTWVGSMKKYGLDNSRETRKAFYDVLLKNRLGPGGRIELDEDMLGFCMKRGLNAFIIDNIPNLKRANKDSYSQEYKDNLKEKLSNYVEKFGPRGWLDGKAYVYNYDEVGREHWHLAKEMYKEVKSVSNDLKVIQCLNIPDGVEALAGYADTWDVYVQQYEKTGVDKRVAEGDEAWLAVCCWPTDRPNFYHEYPAIDGRMIGWICHNTGVTGFEYWSPNHWGNNDSPPQLRGGWIPNTFLKYNGDGYLTYPSGDKRPLSSLRLANLRDGFEDYEYLYLLDELEAGNDLAKQVVTGPMKYSSDPEVLYKTRAMIAKRIEQLKDKN